MYPKNNSAEEGKTSGTAGSAAPQIDYKAETERLKTELAKAQHTIIGLKKEDGKSHVQDSQATSEGGAQATGTSAEGKGEDPGAKAAEVARKEIEKFKLEQSRDSLNDELSKIENPDERELTKTIYENRIVRTGYSRDAIQEDVASARLLANKPRLQTTINELQRAVVSRGTMNSSGTGAGQDPEPPEDPFKNANLTSEEKKWVEATSLRLKKKPAEIIAQLQKNRQKK